MKLKSRYTTTPINEAQYIAEILCERQAKRNKEDLPFQFWNLDKYKRDFLLQLRFANILIKTYSFEAICSALKTPQGLRIYSLGAKWFDPIIRTEQEKIDRKIEVREERSEKVDNFQTDDIVVHTSGMRPAFKTSKSQSLDL